MSERAESAGATEKPSFFAVGARKLAVMHAVTLGLYGVHWLYEHWWRIKERRGARFNPQTRTWLAPFFVYWLFRDISRAAEERRIPTAFSPVGATVLYVLGIVAAYLLVDELGLLVMLLLYLPIHGAQLLANRVNAVETPHLDRNEDFSLGNKIGVAVGGLLFVLSAWGAYEGIRERLGSVVEQGGVYPEPRASEGRLRD